MIRMTMFSLALAAPFAAHAQAPAPQASPNAPHSAPAPEAGGRQPGHPGARDVGPANQPPQTEGPQSINRGTDGAAAGQQLPGATGVTPQGMMGTSTAGAQNPNAPVGGQPPQSSPNSDTPVVVPVPPAAVPTTTPPRGGVSADAPVVTPTTPR
ncbi:MAG: hypothetical protein V4653_04515 [Pseudomonadota bacterium]